ncbi:shikimate kinase [Spongiimicrobium sp. 3-5]|uniref:shikimate kinase n=1 Tax=Spongiimicrobium sp. 3-5 TaxID=3332596 RepID=UPI0039815389
MQVVLVGYMGSGKTTVGQLLANELKYTFLDLDSYMEDAMGMSVSEMFETKGELFFRKKEHFYLKEVLTESKNFVLSTGGGTPCYSGNMDAILENTPNVFYLKVSIMELVKRLGAEKDHRPLIKDIGTNDLPEFFGKHLFERSPFYSKATNVISSDNKTPEDIVEEIKTSLV